MMGTLALIALALMIFLFLVTIIGLYIFKRRLMQIMKAVLEAEAMVTRQEEAVNRIANRIGGQYDKAEIEQAPTMDID